MMIIAELLAGLDIGAFRKQAFLYETADLGPDLCDPEGSRAARQFSGQHDLLGSDRHRGHFRDSGTWLGLRRPVAACKQKTA
jgi:hypothetical protein